jgi:hypothetical protein
MMGDAYRVAKQAYDKKDKTMTTRDAGLTKEQVEAAEVHAAGSSHCGKIKSKSAFSRYSTSYTARRRLKACVVSCSRDACRHLLAIYMVAMDTPRTRSLVVGSWRRWDTSSLDRGSRAGRGRASARGPIAHSASMCVAIVDIGREQHQRSSATHTHAATRNTHN